MIAGTWNYSRLITRTFVTLSLVLFASGAAAATDALVSALTSTLGVTQEQAAGGAGSLFEYAKSELSADDFSSLAEAVPGMGDLLAAAPKADAEGGSSMLSGLASKLGGSAVLADQFSSLGLDPSDVQKFLPVVTDYLETTGGPAASKLLMGLF